MSRASESRSNTKLSLPPTICFQPTIPDECALVDMLIRSEWLLRRYTSVETAVWEQDIHGSRDPFPGDTYLKSQGAFERVGRRMNWAQRNYFWWSRLNTEIRAERAHHQENR